MRDGTKWMELEATKYEDFTCWLFEIICQTEIMRALYGNFKQTRLTSNLFFAFQKVDTFCTEVSDEIGDQLCNKS